MKAACLILILLASCSGWSRSAQASRQEAEYYVTTYALHYRVPVDFVRALIAQESGWQPCAISPKGAAGLMQLMPDTAAVFRVRNRFDVEDNVRAGVAYLAWLRDRARIVRGCSTSWTKARSNMRRWTGGWRLSKPS